MPSMSMKVVTWNVAGLRAETVASSLKQTHHSFTFSANAYYVSLLYFMSLTMQGTVKWRVAPSLRSERIKKEKRIY